MRGGRLQFHLSVCPARVPVGTSWVRAHARVLAVWASQPEVMTFWIFLLGVLLHFVMSTAEGKFHQHLGAALSADEGMYTATGGLSTEAWQVTPLPELSYPSPRLRHLLRRPMLVSFVPQAVHAQHATILKNAVATSPPERPPRPGHACVSNGGGGYHGNGVVTAKTGVNASSLAASPAPAGCGRSHVSPGEYVPPRCVISCACFSPPLAFSRLSPSTVLSQPPRPCRLRFVACARACCLNRFRLARRWPYRDRLRRRHRGGE